MSAVSAVLGAGAVVGERFRVEALAGQGGAGTVYRACDQQTGAVVALKLLHAASASPQTTERFLREIHLLSEIRHPAIVSHVAHGFTAEGRPYLAMEWLDGLDLAKYLQRESLSVADSLLVTRQIAEALAEAHRQGIIHRDLYMLRFPASIRAFPRAWKSTGTNSARSLVAAVRVRVSPCASAAGFLAIWYCWRAAPGLRRLPRRLMTRRPLRARSPRFRRSSTRP